VRKCISQGDAVTHSSSGVLRVIVTSAGPSWLPFRIHEAMRSYGVATVNGTARVRADTVYEVSVALHQAIANTSQPFEPTTSLEGL
jgi:hypothetical protein